MTVYLNPAAESYKIPSSNATSDLPSIVRFHIDLFGGSPTPLIPLDSVATELGVGHVLVKIESSRLGLPAFKILGASWALCSVLADLWKLDKHTMTFQMLRQSAQQHSDFIVIAATDGNHGRACARVASMLGIRSKIYLPSDVPKIARDLIAKEGADVLVINDNYDAAVKFAAQESMVLGEAMCVLIQDTAWEGYEDIPKRIVQGYTTLFSEIDMQLKNLSIPPITHCIVPVGVGSLAHSAIQVYRSQSYPTKVSITTVEPSSAACLNISLHNGARTTVKTSTTIMQGLNCGTVSYTAWPDVKSGIDVSVTVEDRAVLLAIDALGEMGVDAGPCGAASFAALQSKQMRNLTQSSVVVLLVTEGKSE